MTEWTVTLDHSFPEAADLAIRHEAGLHRHSRVPIWLDTSLNMDRAHPRPDYATAYPEPTNRLLTHLLHHTDTLDTPIFNLSRIIHRLRDQLGEAPITPLIDQALRLRVPGI